MFNQLESYIPPGYKKTIDIQEMFDINQMPPNSTGYLYNVGLPHNNPPSIYSIKNNTVNAKLRITLDLPFYLTCDKGNVFYIDPETSTTFSILFNEIETKKRGKGTYTDKMDIKILPTDFGKVVLLRIQPLTTPTPNPTNNVTNTPLPTTVIDPTPTPTGTLVVGKTIVSWSTNASYELIDDPSHSGYKEYEYRNQNYGTPTEVTTT